MARFQRDCGQASKTAARLQSLWLPAIRAQAALDRKNPSAAIEILRAAIPIEFAQIAFVNNTSCFDPTYTRGEAYLAAGQGQAAATEFQKNHSSEHTGNGNIEHGANQQRHDDPNWQIALWIKEASADRPEAMLS